MNGSAPFSPSPRLLAALGLMLGLAGSAQADSVIVGGVNGSAVSQSAFLGRIAPLPGQQFGQGWAYSLFADYLRYRYDADTQRIQAESQGLQAAILREWTLEKSGVFSLAATAGLRNTNLKPADPGNDIDGLKLDPGLQMQWRGDESHAVASGLIASYVPGRESYYAKGFAGARQSGGWAIGPEFSISGDPSYRIGGAGLAVRDLRQGNFRIGLRAGLALQSGRSEEPTAGIDFNYYIP